MQRKGRRRSRARRAAATLALALLVCGLAGVSLSVRADTVASLLGNYTINQFAGIRVGKNQVKLHFVVVLGQLPALVALHKADANDDGVTSQGERDAYVKRLAPGFARGLVLTVDGRRVPLKLAFWTSSLPSESTGFSLRLDAHYVGTLPAGVQTGIHELKFDNANYAGRIGWHEIVVKSGQGVSIFNTNAVSTSLTEGLSINPKKLPPGGPLDERAVHLAFLHGAAPTGVAMLGPRQLPSQGAAQSGALSGQKSGIRATGVAATWLNRQTKELVGFISTPHLTPGVALLALLIAMVLGALHAFSPGHGKTVVGAYLIGSRGTPRHAVFLGLTVTVTHTIGVFALGLAVLFAARFIMPQRIFPILSLVSGLLVVAIGLALFIRRFRAARGHVHAHDHPHTPNRTVAWAGGPNATPPIHEHTHSHDHPHAHTHDHHHVHEHAHEYDHMPHEHGDHRHAHMHAHDHDHVHGTLTHSHGGRVHTHLPPGADGERVTWKSLLGLGISGGLIPCPSAMVLLLATIALNKTAYGLVLVLAFSAGLAVTLSCVGIVFLYARRLFARAKVPGRLVQALPALSAVFITAIGAVICYGAIAGVSISI